MFDRLRAWNIVCLSKCILCDEYVESPDHLFFNCRYTMEMWLKFVRCMSDIIWNLMKIGTPLTCDLCVGDLISGIQLMTPCAPCWGLFWIDLAAVVWSSSSFLYSRLLPRMVRAGRSLATQLIDRRQRCWHLQNCQLPTSLMEVQIIMFFLLISIFCPSYHNVGSECSCAQADGNPTGKAPHPHLAIYWVCLQVA